MGIQKGDDVYYINSPEFTGGLGNREVIAERALKKDDNPCRFAQSHPRDPNQHARANHPLGIMFTLGPCTAKAPNIVRAYSQ